MARLTNHNPASPLSAQVFTYAVKLASICFPGISYSHLNEWEKNNCGGRNFNYF
jgi:hypothetical protein